MNLQSTEKLVISLAHATEEQVRLVISPDVSLLRAAFQGLYYAHKANKLTHSIVEDLGLDVVVKPHQTDFLKIIIAEMESRGSRSGDSLKAILPKLEKMIHIVDENQAMGQPLKLIRAIRKEMNSD
jgi:hypothetical protein